MRKKVFKIAITGPESTGKTVLAKQLAERLACPMCPEFARYYVGVLPRAYDQKDLRHIGRGQKLWEDYYEKHADQVVVLDTDWTVLQVWEHFRFGETGRWYWQEGYGNPRPADCYLLCAPDFPWQPDPLREHPLAREELFVWYLHLLERYGLPYSIIKGDMTRRLEAALTICSL